MQMDFKAPGQATLVIPESLCNLARSIPTYERGLRTVNDSIQLSQTSKFARKYSCISGATLRAEETRHIYAPCQIPAGRCAFLWRTVLILISMIAPTTSCLFSL